MRRVSRLTLDATTVRKLRAKQGRANEKRAAGTLQVQREWDGARQTKPLKVALVTLQRMMGERERCMYCVDSHGCDIEHFWPKAPYPERMFVWDNLLLCCTECGRLKGNRFPLDTDRPLLIDPTLDEPWEHLDFDPATGNIVARFDTRTNDWSPKGTETVKILHLDQREAMASGYTRTFRRISDVVQRALRDEAPVVADLYAALGEADEDRKSVV